MNYQSADKRKIFDSEESGPFPHLSVEGVDNLRVGSNSGGSGKDTVQNNRSLSHENIIFDQSSLLHAAHLQPPPVPTNKYHTVVNEPILYNVDKYTQHLHSGPFVGQTNDTSSVTTDRLPVVIEDHHDKELDASLGDYVEMSENIWQEGPTGTDKSLMDDIYKNLNYSLDEFFTNTTTPSTTTELPIQSQQQQQQQTDEFSRQNENSKSFFNQPKLPVSMGGREYEKRSQSNVSFIDEKDRLQSGHDDSARSKRKHSQYDTNQSFFNPNGPQQASQEMIEFNAKKQRQSTPKHSSISHQSIGQKAPVSQATAQLSHDNSGTDLFKRRMSVTFLDQSGAVASKKQPIIPLLDPSNFTIPNGTLPQSTMSLADGKKSDGQSVPLPNQSSLPDLAAEYATMTESHQSSSSFNGAQFTGYEEGNGSLDDLVSSFPRRSVIFRNAIYPLCDEALEHILENEQLQKQGDFEFITSSTPTLSSFGEFSMLTSEEARKGMNGSMKYSPIDTIQGGSSSSMSAGGGDLRYDPEQLRQAMHQSNSIYFDTTGSRDPKLLTGTNNNGGGGGGGESLVGGNHPYSFVTSDSLPNLNCLMPISGMQHMSYQQMTGHSSSGINYPMLSTPVTPATTGSGGKNDHSSSSSLHSRMFVKKAKTCYSCKTSITPLWRKDPLGNILCNACGLYFKIHGKYKTVETKSSNGTTQVHPVRRKKMEYNNGLVLNSNHLLALGIDPSSLLLSSSSSSSLDQQQQRDLFLLESSDLLNKFERYCQERNKTELEQIEQILLERLEIVRRLIFGQINTATTPIEGVKRNNNGNSSSNNNSNSNQLVPNVPSVLIDEQQ